MNPNVHWEWVLLAGTAASSGSHRVARRGTSAFAPPAGVTSSGDDNATASGMGWIWSPSSAAKAQPTLSDGSGHNFVLAFWWVQGGTTAGVPVGESIVSEPFSVPVGADGNASARAFYVWNFGTGPGANAILIDALDLNTGFFAEDFVNINPEDGKAHSDTTSLYFKANDGYLKTEGQDRDVKAPLTLTAFDANGRKFHRWLEVPALTFPPMNGPTISGTDVHVMPGARLVAFAIYTTPPPVFIPRRWHYEIYDPLWPIKTHGGLTPPMPPWGPPEPWAREYLGALALAQAASQLEGKARGDALKLALNQLAATAARLKREITPRRGGG